MAASSTFADSGADAINRTIDPSCEDKPLNLSSEQFADYYDIDRTVAEIVKGGYKRVALQFPDELLRDSVPIFRALKSRLGRERELYVLADTSYGSCCVDEVAAQHVDADAMVHYGHACVSQTSRLPVIYVFGKKEIDSAECVDKFVEFIGGSSSTSLKHALMLRLDVSYAHRADVILDKLRVALADSNRILYTLIPLITYPHSKDPEATPSDASSTQKVDGDGANDVSAEDCTILYVGGESLSLTNLLVTHASCEVYSYDPHTRTVRQESLRTNRLLMRRYATMQKARDADVFGILVGTLGVASYLPLISHLRKILTRAHKKSYTISVGKLNPAKLANFLEIECFILVACPENSLIEAKEFLRPIITPYELKIALQSEQSWTGRYVLDFKRLLEANRDLENVDNDDSQEDPNQPMFSLVTGKYRHAKRYGDTSSDDVELRELSSLIVRNQDNTVATLSDSAGAQFLHSRTFKGLETRLGQDAPSMLEQGRRGIARGYEDDHRS